MSLLPRPPAGPPRAQRVGGTSLTASSGSCRPPPPPAWPQRACARPRSRAPPPHAAGPSPGGPEQQQQQQQLQQLQQHPHEDDQQQQQQPATAAVPAPLPSGEPDDEAPKQLSPAARLSETLASTSIAIVGDDTDLNWAVCQALSKKIGWFPVSTAKVLAGMHKAASVAEVEAKQGRNELVKAEATVLRGMRDQLRCCVATLGDGAAADPALYPNLYGSIIVWLDEQDKRAPKPASATRALYQANSEVRAVLQKATGGFGDKDVPLEDKAQRAATQLVKAMNQLLKEHSYLPAKKRAYVELGCRGDWPDLQPPEWNPVVEGLAAARQPAPGA